jgi:AcrR family transcriptional regulator
VPRPTDHEKRKEIALAALDVVRREGIQQVTMASLAQALGLKRPTLYFYFPSIPHIFAALFEILREDELTFVGGRLAGAGHPLDALMIYLRAEHAFAAQRGLDDVTVLMASFWASGNAEDRERFRALILKDLVPARALFVALLQQGIAQGRVAPCDPDALVDMVFALQDGLLLQQTLRQLDAEPVFCLIESHLLAPLRR